MKPHWVLQGVVKISLVEHFVFWKVQISSFKFQLSWFDGVSIISKFIPSTTIPLPSTRPPTTIDGSFQASLLSWERVKILTLCPTWTKLGEILATYVKTFGHNNIRSKKKGISLPPKIQNRVNPFIVISSLSLVFGFVLLIGYGLGLDWVLKAKHYA